MAIRAHTTSLPDSYLQYVWVLNLAMFAVCYLYYIVKFYIKYLFLNTRTGTIHQVYLRLDAALQSESLLLAIAPFFRTFCVVKLVAILDIFVIFPRLIIDRIGSFFYGV